MKNYDIIILHRSEYLSIKSFIPHNNVLLKVSLQRGKTSNVYLEDRDTINFLQVKSYHTEILFLRLNVCYYHVKR